MPKGEDDDAKKRIRRLLGGKTDKGRRSKGNPPKDWQKKHPRPKDD